MRFAFGSKPVAPLNQFAAFVRLGEELGFDAAFVPDQTFYPDPFVSVAHCLHKTDQIEMVIGVVNPYTRHPAQVARAVAALDDLAPGRISLGYGAGNRKELIVPLGQEQNRPVARCREAIQIVRRLLRGETVQYRSESLVADGVELEMPAHPDVPIYLAGRGPKMLEAAGEVADVAIIGALLSPEGLDFAVQHVLAGAVHAGRDLTRVGVMSWITCYITKPDETDLWVEHHRPSAAHILAGAPPPVFEALGLTESFMRQLKAEYAEGGSRRAAHLVSDDLVHALAAIGPAGAVIEQLQMAAERGVNQVGILVNAPSHAESDLMLYRFAGEVMPHLR